MLLKKPLNCISFAFSSKLKFETGHFRNLNKLRMSSASPNDVHEGNPSPQGVPPPEIPDIYKIISREGLSTSQQSSCISPEQESQRQISAFQQHQKHAAKLFPAEAMRTLMSRSRFAVLCTLSNGNPAVAQAEAAPEGWPAGSVVEFAIDDSNGGAPIISTSGLSPHTKDLLRDGRASITVMTEPFEGMDSARATMQGRFTLVTDEAKRAQLRDIYLRKHPNAFYIDFPDFLWFSMDEILAIRYNGGFAMARKLMVADYREASTDPIAPFIDPIRNHMNKDHEKDLIAMIQWVTHLKVDKAKVTSVDRLGMDTLCFRHNDLNGSDASTTPGTDNTGSWFRARLPFSRAAKERMDVRKIVVEMTMGARKALGLEMPGRGEEEGHREGEARPTKVQ
nr:FMn-binding split barrel (FMnbP) [Polytomella parva]